MSLFSEENCVKKLKDLNGSQQSIQTLSLWLIHHRKHYQLIVQIWFKELQRSVNKRKLPLIYLANDVIQSSRKKGQEFTTEFSTVLRNATSLMAKHGDEKSIKAFGRVLNVWEERNVYSKKYTDALRKILNATSSKHVASSSSSSPKRTAGAGATSSSSVAERRRPSSDRHHHQRHEPKKAKHADEDQEDANDAEATMERLDAETVKNIREEIHEEVSKSKAAQIERPPPDADKLVELLRSLDNAASSDAGVREQISSLPPQVSDLPSVSALQDVNQAKELLTTVSGANVLLSKYNERLAEELSNRKNMSIMLQDFYQLQKDQLKISSDKLEETKSKLEKISEVRRELNTHLENLPDLHFLEEHNTELQPLPSAGDLFAAAPPPGGPVTTS